MYFHFMVDSLSRHDIPEGLAYIGGNNPEALTDYSDLIYMSSAYHHTQPPSHPEVSLLHIDVCQKTIS